jgi:alkylation response protein AidB-like acyl-CoA dehydrogenase
MKAQDTSQLFFDNVKVPKRMGDEKMGFKIMMEELARERLTVGINAVATAEEPLKTVIYTTEERLLKFRLPAFKIPNLN